MVSGIWLVLIQNHTGEQSLIIIVTELTFCCRSFKSRHNILYLAQRNILDGNLIWSYLNLSSKDKSDFAKQIGTSSGQVGLSIIIIIIYN